MKNQNKKQEIFKKRTGYGRKYETEVQNLKTRNEGNSENWNEKKNLNEKSQAKKICKQSKEKVEPNSLMFLKQNKM